MPSLHRLAAAFLALVTALLAPAAAQDAPQLAWAKGYAAKSLSESAGGMRFELRNGNAGRLPDQTSRIGRTAYVAAPAGSSVRWTLVEAEWREWASGQPSATIYSLDAPGSAGEIPPQMRSGAARFVDTFRGVGMFACDFTVAAFPANGGTGTVAAIERAVYDVVWEGASAEGEITAEELARRDPYLLEFMPHAVLNPGQLSAAWRPDAASPFAGEAIEWNRVLSAGCERGPVVLLKAVRGGIHSITATELAAAGVDTTKLEASGLAAYIDGKPFPIAIENERSGPFVGDMAVWLDVPFASSERTAWTPVWLMMGEDGTQLRLSTPERSQAERDIAPTVTMSVEIADPKFYDPDFAFTERMGRWATQVCAPGRFVSLPFDLPAIDPAAGGKVTISLGGVDRLESQISEISINGTVVGVAERFTGTGPSQRECTIPAGLLREGENQLSIRYPDERSTRLGERLVIAWAEIVAPVDLQKLPTGVPIHVEAKPNSHVSGYAKHRSQRRFGSINGTDRTNPSDPRRLLAVYRGSEGDTMRFEVTMPVGDTGRGEFFLSIPGEDFRFPAREPYVHVDLVSPETGADYLIVAHPRFVETLAPLVRSREAQGQTVRVATIDKIDAVFAHGRHGYRSVEELLRHAWNSWPGKRLSHVLIVGEASEYWWEMRLARPGVSENAVPIHGFAQKGTDIRGDDRYARLSGSGPIPDVEIGRISVTDPEELETVRRKIASYETAPPSGAWMSRHMFFTDDEAEFGAVADKIVRLSLNRNAEAERHFLQDYPWEDYFRLVGRKRSTEMTQAIVDGLSRGALTATYLGHGGPNLWAGERIFHYRDISSIDNPGRFPIMAAASCNTAWIDYPDSIVTRSIGEQFLAAPRAGCIALFAPVSGTSSQEHDIILRPFLDSIASRRFETVGSAVVYAKMMYMLDRNQGYVPEQFVLLGDPMTRIPRPSDRIAMSIDPAAVFLGEPATMKVAGEVVDLPWGTAEAVVLDEAGFEVVPSARAEIVAGRFGLELPLPPTLKEEPHRLVVHAWNESAGRHERKEYLFEVVGPGVSLAWTADPPPSVETAPGTPVVLKLEAGISARYGLDNVVMRIRNVTANNDLTSGTVNLEPGKGRQWEFRIPTPPGVTQLEATASFANADESAPPLAKSRIEVFGRIPEAQSVSVASTLARAERRASPDRTEFTIPAFNVSSRALRIGTAELRSGEALIASTSPSAVLAPGTSADLFLSTTEFLPTGERRFDLTIAAFDAETREEFRQEFPVFVTIPPGADLSIVPGSVRLERRDYQKGETVFVLATVENVGETIVERTSVDLYVDVPWDSNALAATGMDGTARLAIDSPILPRGKRDVRLRWDPPQTAPDAARLYVVANPDRRVYETSWSNNVGDADVSFRRLPNLAIDKSQARISTQHVAKGDVVSLSIPIVNDSPYDFAHRHLAEIDVAGEGEELRIIYREHLPPIAAGESTVIQTSWRADGLRDHIAVSINSEREFGESSGADNSTSFALEYISNWRATAEPDGSWNIARLFGEGVRRSAVAGPDGGLLLSERPKRPTSIAFDNRHVVGEPLVEQANKIDDGLISIVEGALVWNAEESPDPVSFRMPLPADDGTTVYDVHFSHLGSISLDGRPTNQYAWEIEGTPGETDYEKRIVQSPWIGRIETVDDFLDLTIRPTDAPARNSILAVVVHPVAGDWTSPWIEIDGLRACTLETESETPPGTEVLLEMRTGEGNRADPAYGPWERVAPGDPVAARPKARMMQWRATLKGSVSESPSLRSAVVRFGKPARVPEPATGGGS